MRTKSSMITMTPITPTTDTAITTSLTSPPLGPIHTYRTYSNRLVINKQTFCRWCEEADSDVTTHISGGQSARVGPSVRRLWVGEHEVIANLSGRRGQTKSTNTHPA